MYDETDECAGECVTYRHKWSPSGARCERCNLIGTGDTCGDGECEEHPDYPRPQYVATMNTPGYLPWADEPAVFDTARAAWEYLAYERERQEDEAGDYAELVGGGDAYSDTRDLLRDRAEEGAGEGTVYGETPGSDSEHDLGIAYSVTLVETDDL